MANGKIDDVFEEKFMTASKFSMEIEKIVRDSDLITLKQSFSSVKTRTSN